LDTSAFKEDPVVLSDYAIDDVTEIPRLEAVVLFGSKYPVNDYADCGAYK
jgi:hypothetical protein